MLIVLVFLVHIQVWYDVHTFQKHNGMQNLYIPVTLSSVRGFPCFKKKECLFEFYIHYNSFSFFFLDPSVPAWWFYHPSEGQSSKVICLHGK